MNGQNKEDQAYDVKESMNRDIFGGNKISYSSWLRVISSIVSLI